MSTNLSRFFRQRRLDLGLRLPDVARRCGYQNLSKGSNKINRFEESGEIHVGLYPKLATALGIDQITCDRLNEEDRQQARRDWLDYLATPIKPYLAFRAIPGVFFSKNIPEGCTTIEEMEAFATEFIGRGHKETWLVVSRKLTIRFARDGSKISVDEATPDCPNAPVMRLKKGRTPFLFGCDSGASVKPLQKMPRLPQEQADD
jgi:hypothetical protein